MHKRDEKILILYNAPVSYFENYVGKPNEDVVDLSETQEIDVIKKSLEENFLNVNSFAVRKDLREIINFINIEQPDVIFNFVESIEGVSSFEYCIAGLYELLKVEFTGNLPFSLGNCLDKQKAKKILRASGINTPNHRTFKFGEKNIDDFNLTFPVILKLLKEDASIGISEYSVVRTKEDLIERLDFLYKNYHQDVLCEEYIEGREFNIAVLGSKALSVSEIEFDGLPEGLPNIVTYEGKWVADSVYYKFTKPRCPANLDDEIKHQLQAIALASFHALGCRDYARVDVRMNKENIPYVIEVNPNPDISTDSGFARAAKAEGLTYSDLLLSIADLALKRRKYDQKVKAS